MHALLPGKFWKAGRCLGPRVSNASLSTVMLAHVKGLEALTFCTDIGAAAVVGLQALTPQA